ncbi:MAG: YfmQ family protein [Alicyclobacillus herbarius]|uniref:YfmQ family protein n=1 Tax=Alicyclobacillus herbarius TaxID=122960 RepID=UPI002353B80A|nr:YfmQ family protein [Alicyclobacillus herbarius]MCL6631748.1 YfmQ family protein [Alicyclobacillus herbarius]
MSTWLWWFIPLFVVLVILAFIASPPEAVAKWFVAKFEVHPQLSDANTIVTIDGNQVGEEDKRRFIDNFNKAIFIDRYYQVIPKPTGTPVVIKTKQRKNNVMFFVYIYEDRVDVFKQINQKVIAYRLLSDSLQKGFPTTQTTFVQA